MLPGMKIKSSTNHFWWPPCQIYPFSVLWKCPYSWGLKNWEAYIKEKVSGVPWHQISQSTLTAGNCCNKYHILIDVSYISGCLVWDLDKISSISAFLRYRIYVWIHTHWCVTFKAAEHCLCYTLYTCTILAIVLLCSARIQFSSRQLPFGSINPDTKSQYNLLVP